MWCVPAAEGAEQDAVVCVADAPGAKSVAAAAAGGGEAAAGEGADHPGSEETGLSLFTLTLIMSGSEEVIQRLHSTCSGFPVFAV